MTSAEYKLAVSYQVEKEQASTLANAYRHEALAVQRHQYSLAAKVLLLVFLLSLSTVFCYVQGALMGYQVAHLSHKVAALKTDNQALKLKVAELSSPERVERIATTKLGMIRPSDTMMVAVASPPSRVEVVALRAEKGQGRDNTWSKQFFDALSQLFSGQQKVGVRD